MSARWLFQCTNHSPACPVAPLIAQLFERMLREECRPNVVTYNSLIGACGQGGALDKAAEVFEHMVSHGCRPDAVTFSVLIAAYERGGEWGKAVQVRVFACVGG